ncbi:hypothetical protein VB735_04615 [Halotia wernerae UHCC 0503]|nr:hypothetical protein [Halotia wernerae UHCC 0503]
MQDQAAEISKAAEPQKALANTIEKIRQFLDLKIIFASSIKGVQRLLEVDRIRQK